MWSDDIDEIIMSDQVFALGLATPAHGVIVSPLTNHGLRDRDSATLSRLGLYINSMPRGASAWLDVVTE